MAKIYTSQADEDTITAVLRKGFRASGPKWTVLRLALALSLKQSDDPDASFDQIEQGGRGSEYTLEILTGSSQKEDAGFVDAFCALLSVRHGVDLFANETLYTRWLQRHVRRGLKEIQTTSTLPKGVTVTDKMSTAEVQVHPNGKFVYGSNRGHDTIAVFSIASNGTLTLQENVSTQGKIPRNFSIDPTGSFLLAANQDSNTIVVFRIDKKTGRLTPTGQTVETPAPICVKFLAVK